MNRTLLILLLSMLAISIPTRAEEKKTEKDPLEETSFAGLQWRSIGPAIASGRIIDFAVEPNNPSHFWVAVACGGVWKTTNHGHTFTSVFDGQRSFSIGCLAMDPTNPYVVWVGTGENNSQRSVAYGDGVYKTTDGGKSWNCVGLKLSEHIGKILIDPQNPDIVYVAAQGPLWGPGGDRGLYKTTDGGKNWEKILDISVNTGVSDIVIDPRNSDVLYCSSYQRRRHVWTLINGGPESAVYKSVDGGKTWNKLTNGLPGGDVGRIGLAISPVDPDYIYAVIEAAESNTGFYRSTDRGASWEKRSSYATTSGQYYNEVFCNPLERDVVYLVDTYAQISTDGGATFRTLGNKNRHVDDHALWLDPNNPDYILIGGDGGVYESYDRGANWRYFENLPITQFYRVGLDNAEPFYYVYGGTQDNNSYGGPSRTIKNNGIANEDWFKVVGGDGFQPRIDPDDPNIVYAQPQHGVLCRFDRKSGELTYIQPQPGKGEFYRWNWDSPMIISPHKGSRLYFAANVLFKSDDRGNSWTRISPDLTRQIDRNTLPVMDKIWYPEAVAKNASTSLYGNIVSLAESPKKAGLLYVGTDDGLIQVSEDDGRTWRKIESFPGVPETTYVSDIFPSQFDENIVFATFDNHKRADFKPYVLMSTDKGRTWTSISSNLPENGYVHCIYQDHVKPELLFAGTEFSFYFSVDGGKKWHKLNNGLPPNAIMDMEIQKRENDIVVATFGRSFYVLDDYTPLREITPEMLDKESFIFPVKDALIFQQDDSHNRDHMGITYYNAENPPYGAAITYYLKESIKTKKEIRKEKEKGGNEDKAGKDNDKKKDKKSGNIGNQDYAYPTPEELKAEDEEQKPYLLFTITDNEGNIIRRMTAPAVKGIGRTTWDLAYPAPWPVSERTDPNKYGSLPTFPGTYKVSMAKVVNGVETALCGPVSFRTKMLNNKTLPAKDPSGVFAFQKKINNLQRALSSANSYYSEASKRATLIEKALVNTPASSTTLIERVKSLKKKLDGLGIKLYGDNSLSKRNAGQPPAINERLDNIVWGSMTSTDLPQTFLDLYKLVSAEFRAVLDDLKQIGEKDLKDIENEMEKLGSPWTPGRFPDWQPE